MGGKVGKYLLFIYYLHFYIYKLNFFKKINLLPKFLSNLTSQKDHLWLVQKTTNQVGRVQINLSNMTKWSS